MDEINGLHYPQAILLGSIAIGAGVAVGCYFLMHGIAAIGEGLERVAKALELCVRLRSDHD